MSENAGVLLSSERKPYNVMLQEEELDSVPSLVRTRSGVLRNPAIDVTSNGRVGEKHLYSPFKRGIDIPNRYTNVPPLGKAHRMEPVLKSNPRLPTTSYVPTSVILQDEVAPDITRTQVGRPGLYDPYPPAADIPDPMGVSPFSANKDYVNQVKTVRAIIGDRAERKRRTRFIMDRVNPARPEVLDIHAHRKLHQVGKSPFEDVRDKQTLSAIQRVVSAARPVPAM